jgi:NAD-dependent SIR2 family protein deacetylase
MEEELQWYCFKCKEKMEEDEVWMSYMEIERPQPAIKCPVCGAAYLTEKIVIEQVRPGEEEIEAKF